MEELLKMITSTTQLIWKTILFCIVFIHTSFSVETRSIFDVAEISDEGCLVAMVNAHGILWPVHIRPTCLVIPTIEVDREQYFLFLKSNVVAKRIGIWCPGESIEINTARGEVNALIFVRELESVKTQNLDNGATAGYITGVNGFFLQERIIRAGLARFDKSWDKSPFFTILQNAEDLAKRNGMGVWNFDGGDKAKPSTVSPTPRLNPQPPASAISPPGASEGQSPRPTP